ncbi:isoamylase early set domain-containing protein [Thalassotalea sp. PLHSN55]|uniref:isoamylase early set domain-containing protein n=1 Tax=Thalassotalea sp. PLHSN55 TaxID=3435888 RepID=UPI003F84CD1D
MLTKRFFKTKNETEITFEHPGEIDNQVELIAEFNDWQPLAMTYSKKHKAFRAKVRLPKDTDFQFRYLVNNEIWQNDHQADRYLLNSFGTDNSVVSTSQA